METYHKIQTLFKRHQDGKHKGKMIKWDWTTPELEYLSKNQWEFTEKVDGTNIRIGWEMCKHPEYAGRTDRAEIPKPLLEYLQDTFTAILFEDALGDDLDGKSIPVVLFGEGYGPKIQGGGKYVQSIIEANRGKDKIDQEREHKFVLFDVKIGDFWLDRENVDDIAQKLGIESVPTIGYGTLLDAIAIVEDGYNFNSMGRIVRYGSGTLQSKWGSFDAEGIVARPEVPMFDRKGQRIITKIKGVDFK